MSYEIATDVGKLFRSVAEEPGELRELVIALLLGTTDVFAKLSGCVMVPPAIFLY